MVLPCCSNHDVPLSLWMIRSLHLQWHTLCPPSFTPFPSHLPSNHHILACVQWTVSLAHWPWWCSDLTTVLSCTWLMLAYVLSADLAAMVCWVCFGGCMVYFTYISQNQYRKYPCQHIPIVKRPCGKK